MNGDYELKATIRKVGEMGMTREEAIELLDILPLCNECDSSNFPYTCAECGDAFLLAMEALKQQEVIRCKDCKHGKIHGIDVECVAHEEVGYDPEPWHPLDWFCADGEKKVSE